jgi:hypothetical protein
MENCQFPAIAPFCCESLEDELPPQAESMSVAASSKSPATRVETAQSGSADGFLLSQWV